MKIAAFWAKGFRSLRELNLDGLEAANVFYGPNGSGKSNILNGLATLFRLLRVLGEFGATHQVGIGLKDGGWTRAFALEAGNLLTAKTLSRRDLSAGGATLQLGARCEGLIPVPQIDLAATVTVEVSVDWTIAGAPMLWLSRLEFDSRVAAYEHGLPREVVKFLAEDLPRGFALVDSDRFPHEESTSAGSKTSNRSPVLAELAAGHLKTALFIAQTSPDRTVRDRLRLLRELLQGPPLNRPRFDAVQDPVSLQVDVLEQLGDGDISLDLMGLGLAQVYAILSGIVLSGARAVAVEEPEAHLHAPTSGVALRRLLARLLEEKIVDQLFVATHSNLFDLNPDSYWDVKLGELGTVATREPLARIDRDHLYEPGPAKHALQQLLRYAPANEVVFHRANGTPITASEMLSSLESDDETAIEFLRSIHGAALRIVRRSGQGTGAA